MKMKGGAQGGLLGEAFLLSVQSNEEKTRLKCVRWGWSNSPPCPMAVPLLFAAYLRTDIRSSQHKSYGGLLAFCAEGAGERQVSNNAAMESNIIHFENG